MVVGGELFLTVIVAPFYGLIFLLTNFPLMDCSITYLPKDKSVLIALINHKLIFFVIIIIIIILVVEILEVQKCFSKKKIEVATGKSIYAKRKLRIILKKLVRDKAAPEFQDSQIVVNIT